MEITTEAELYVPSINTAGNYIDKIPPFKNGIRCPCGSRKDKTYETHALFSLHTKTAFHQKWLQNLNNNRTNLFAENEQMKTTIKQQQQIIARMDIEIQNKHRTIDVLTQQIYSNITTTTPQHNCRDLLEMDV